MFAADSSSLIDYLNSMKRVDCQKIEAALLDNKLVLPPVVITEILSNVISAEKFILLQDQIKILEITGGYWQRAGIMREKIIRQGLKARLPDTLIAQSCIDHDVQLIANDTDFKKFTKFGLKLAT